MNRRDWLLCGGVALVGLLCGVCGIDWGLPSRERVALLGDDLDAIRSQIDTDRREDRLVYAHEPEKGSIDLSRAYRRYFLYTHQPDEMLTLMGLARMKPAQFDFHPHQFQYGGLFTYPIGALIFLSGKLGLLTVSSNLGVYLEDPSLFGRMYLFGRLFVTAFYIATGVLVFQFGRRIAGSVPGFIAAVLFLLCPGAIVFSHEMKPHAAAPFFVLLMFYWLFRLLEDRRRRFLWLATIACGAATAMVYSNELFLLAVLCCVWFVHGIGLRERLTKTVGCCAIVAAVYFVFNPYVLLDFDTLLEEVRLIRVRYEPGFRVMGVVGFIQNILLSSLGLPTSVLAIWGLINLVRRRDSWSLISLGMIVLYTTLLVYQLGEQSHSAKMARLMCALFPLFAVLAAVGLRAIPRMAAQIGVGLASMCWMIWLAWPYLLTYHIDAGSHSSRLEAGRWINEHIEPGASIAVPPSPAPYKAPPFAFAKYDLVTDTASRPDYIVTVGYEVADNTYRLAKEFRHTSRETPLSFADQPVFVYRREGK